MRNQIILYAQKKYFNTIIVLNLIKHNNAIY